MLVLELIFLGCVKIQDTSGIQIYFGKEINNSDFIYHLI